MASNKKAILILFISSALLFITMGLRQSFGIILIPLSDFSSASTSFASFTFAVQNVIFAIPIYGLLIAWLGYRKVSQLGALFIILGFLIVIFKPTPTFLFWGLLIVGLGFGQNGFVLGLGSIANFCPESKKSTYFGIATASASLGMFAFVPLVHGVLNNFEFKNSLFLYLIFGLIMLAIGLGLPNKGDSKGDSKKDSLLKKEKADELIFKKFFKKTFKNTNYILLNLGFLVCGFHVAFIAIHLPTYLQNNGISANISAWSLALIGLMNIFGSLFWGRLGDFYDKRITLSIIYFLRSLAILGLVSFPLNSYLSLSFGAVIGFLWLGTVPLTSGLVYHFFSGAHFNTRYNVVFFSHQVGAFIGIYLGGYFYQVYQNYDYVWYLAILLGLLSGGVHLLIKKTKKVERESFI